MIRPAPSPGWAILVFLLLLWSAWTSQLVFAFAERRRQRRLLELEIEMSETWRAVWARGLELLAKAKTAELTPAEHHELTCIKAILEVRERELGIAPPKSQ